MSSTPRRYWNAELDQLRWAELQGWQCERLGESIADILSRSRFYARKLSSAEKQIAAAPAGAAAIELLGGLPFTTKDELRAAAEAGGPEQPLGENQAVPTTEVVQLLSSSGTSGRPVYYGLTKADRARWADGVANMFFTAGIRPEDVVVHLTSLPMVAGGLTFADGLRETGSTLAWLGGYSPEQMLSPVRTIGATCLSATTSFLLYLTKSCELLTGLRPAELGIRKLLGGGEPGLGEAEVRDELREAWGAEIDVREIMGLSDVMAGLWAECEAHAGMHFTGAGQVYAELIEPDSGERLDWQEGMVGEVVYTALGRDATPLIRFRSGDQVVIEGVGCSCGRGTPRIRCLGRIDDMLIYKGMNVFPSAIRDVAARAGGDRVTTNMRVWRERPDQVRFDLPIPLEVEAAAPLEAAAATALADQIAAEVRKHLQVRVAVTLLEPGSIPRTDYKASLLHTLGQDEQSPRASSSGSA